MTKKYKLIILIIVAAVVGVYFYRSATRIETVRVSGAEAANFKFLFSVIKDKKFDKKNNLNLEFVWSNPGEVERKLVAKEEGVEVGPYNPISLAETNLKGEQQLRSFAPLLYTYYHFIVKADSPFHTLEDLRGAKIATRPKLSAAYKSLAIALKIAGMDLENDFKLTFGSIPENVKALTTGEADATLMSPPESVGLLVTGKYRQIAELENIWEKAAGASMPLVSLTAHKSWIEQNPRKVKRLRKTILDAATFIRENPQVVEEYKDLLNIQTDATLKLMKESLPLSYPASWNDEAHHFAITKAMEFGIIKSIPHEDIFIH